MAYCYEVSQAIGMIVGIVGAFLIGIIIGYKLKQKKE